MGQLFIENSFEKLTGWIKKFTADQQLKLVARVIGDKYDSPECCALAGVVVAFLILLASWSIIELANFTPSIESIWLRTYVILFCWLCIIFLSILAIWWAAGAFSYPVRVIFVDIPKGGSIKSPTRSILLFFVNYFEIIVHFSSLYILTNSITHKGSFDSFISMPKAIYFSIVTITTLGDVNFGPATLLGMILVSVEVLVGMIMIVAVLAGFLQERDKKTKQ
jgi:hypothetical protein